MLSGPIATAAQAVSATIIGPLDGQGNVKVHDQGTANVNVNGTVPTQGAIPATEFSIDGGPVPFVVSGLDPAGTNYAITSVSFSNLEDTARGFALEGFYGNFSDCGEFQNANDFSFGPGATVPAHETVSETFPPPFVIDAGEPGANSCLVVIGANGKSDFTVVGYTF